MLHLPPRLITGEKRQDCLTTFSFFFFLIPLQTFVSPFQNLNVLVQAWAADWLTDCVCVCVRLKTLGIPWLIRCPCAEPGNSVDSSQLAPAGPERITLGREQNDRSLSNSLKSCQDFSCCSGHRLTKTQKPHLFCQILYFFFTLSYTSSSSPVSSGIFF